MGGGGTNPTHVPDAHQMLVLAVTHAIQCLHRLNKRRLNKRVVHTFTFKKYAHNRLCQVVEFERAGKVPKSAA